MKSAFEEVNQSARPRRSLAEGDESSVHLSIKLGYCRSWTVSVVLSLHQQQRITWTDMSLPHVPLKSSMVRLFSPTYFYFCVTHSGSQEVTVWQCDQMLKKSNPNVSKSCPKKNQLQFIVKNDVFQNSSKSLQIFWLSLLEILLPRTLNIAQSGHTDVQPALTKGLS